MSFSTTLGRPSLNDKLLQVCALHVRVLARVSDAVEAPLSSDGASVAMLTPFNCEKLESLAFLNAGGEGVIAARNFPRELPPFHGPNVRFAVCMDGAGNARDANLLRTDKLEVPTVIYGNATASLGELMLENGQRRTSPLRLVASSSDEHGYKLVLELTPQGTAQHYTAANLARVARVSEQHVPMDLIARALQECVRVRRQAMVGYLQTQGVPEIDASTFYMTLPMGSLYDISAAADAGDAEDAKPVTVDILQWQALVSKTSAALAETPGRRWPSATSSSIASGWACSSCSRAETPSYSTPSSSSRTRRRRRWSRRPCRTRSPDTSPSSRKRCTATSGSGWCP